MRRLKLLDTCTYYGSSTIDHRTLEKSKSKQLPLAFLRGIGLPDNFIEYLPSVLNQAARRRSLKIRICEKYALYGWGTSRISGCDESLTRLTDQSLLRAA
jgi:hypothetical protein